jgi:(p)ppGpp synthase/HD superfamily hydrolase
VGARDELIAAGALHDAIEKADVTAAELRNRFGNRVAELVLAVTEDETIGDYAKRKAALREQVSRSDDEALTLFAADKLSKVRELRRRAGTPPRRRLAHYRQSLALLQARLPDCPLSAQLDAELRQLPAATAKAAATRGH